MRPQAKDLLHITRRASVQFRNPFLFRVIRVHEWKSYVDGWIWLDGYQLDATGMARDRRVIFVQLAGLTYVREQGDANNTRRRTGTRPKGRNRNARTRGQVRALAYVDTDPDRP